MAVPVIRWIGEELNELISRLNKMHGEWLKNSQLAMAATHDEQKAKCIAADKYAVQLMEMIPEIVQRIRELEAEADILADRLACHNPNCDRGFDVKYWRNWAREKREKK